MEAILREHVSVIASFIGWIIGIISCALPWWKVIINGQPPITLEGIWMRCVQETDQEKRCVYYKSTQEISTDLLAARFCCISSIVLGMLGVLLSVVGSKCTNCTQSRVKVKSTAAVILICAAVLLLIPLGWCAYTFIAWLIQPVPGAGIQMPGKSFYLGGASALLLLVGGALNFPCKKHHEKVLGLAQRVWYTTNMNNIFTSEW